MISQNFAYACLTILKVKRKKTQKYLFGKNIYYEKTRELEVTSGSGTFLKYGYKNIKIYRI